MKIKRIDHVTINIIDIGKTKYFYHELLGLEELSSIDMGDHLLRYFKISDTEKLELTEYRFLTRFDPSHDAKDKGTVRHIAFVVDNAYEIEKKLEANGYYFHVPVSYNEKLGFSGGLVNDPNGIELEFLHYGR